MFYKGKVTNIQKGENGDFAFANILEDENLKVVTFSLEELAVWREMKPPNPGDLVVVKDVRKKKVRGKEVWWAFNVRAWRPEDDKDWEEQKQSQQNQVGAQKVPA